MKVTFHKAIVLAQNDRYNLSLKKGSCQFLAKVCALYWLTDRLKKDRNSVDRAVL